jgi:hypothetical protein
MAYQTAPAPASKWRGWTALELAQELESLSLSVNYEEVTGRGKLYWFKVDGYNFDAWFYADLIWDVIDELERR